MRGVAGAGEDLAVPQAQRQPTLGGGGQVAIEVAVPVGHHHVVHPAVELDDQSPVLVGDVSPHRPAAKLRPDLASSHREPVCALDAGEVLPLEHRARARLPVVQHRTAQGPTRHPRPAVERGAQPGGRRTPSTCRFRKGRDGAELVRRPQRHVQDRLLQPHPGRAEFPEDPVTEAGPPVHHEAGRSDEPAIPLDHDVHPLHVPAAPPGPFEGTPGGLVGQRSRPGPKHGSPGTLLPRGRTRVLDVHPTQNLHQLAPPHEACDHRAVRTRERQQLAARDDPVLVAQQPREVVHARQPFPTGALPRPRSQEPVDNWPRAWTSVTTVTGAR